MFPVPAPGFKKFEVPSDPLENESKRREWGPPPGWRSTFVSDKVRQQVELNSTFALTDGPGTAAQKKARLMAAELYCFQELVQGYYKQADDEFMKGFYDFLRGTHPACRDRDLVPWGNHALIGPGIEEYLKEILHKKFNFDIKTSMMNLLIPANLEEAWNYYCFKIKQVGDLTDLYFSSIAQFYGAPTGEKTLTEVKDKLLADNYVDGDAPVEEADTLGPIMNPVLRTASGSDKQEWVGDDNEFRKTFDSKLKRFRVMRDCTISYHVVDPDTLRRMEEDHGEDSEPLDFIPGQPASVGAPPDSPLPSPIASATSSSASPPSSVITTLYNKLNFMGSVGVSGSKPVAAAPATAQSTNSLFNTIISTPARLYSWFRPSSATPAALPAGASASAPALTTPAPGPLTQATRQWREEDSYAIDIADETFDSLTKETVDEASTLISSTPNSVKDPEMFSKGVAEIKEGLADGLSSSNHRIRQISLDVVELFKNLSSTSDPDVRKAIVQTGVAKVHRDSQKLADEVDDSDIGSVVNIVSGASKLEVAIAGPTPARQQESEDYMDLLTFASQAAGVDTPLLSRNTPISLLRGVQNRTEEQLKQRRKETEKSLTSQKQQRLEGAESEWFEKLNAVLLKHNMSHQDYLKMKDEVKSLNNELLFSSQGVEKLSRELTELLQRRINGPGSAELDKAIYDKEQKYNKKKALLDAIDKKYNEKLAITNEIAMASTEHVSAAALASPINLSLMSSPAEVHSAVQTGIQKRKSSHIQQTIASSSFSQLHNIQSSLSNPPMSTFMDSDQFFSEHLKEVEFLKTPSRRTRTFLGEFKGSLRMIGKDTFNSMVSLATDPSFNKGDIVISNSYKSWLKSHTGFTKKKQLRKWLYRSVRGRKGEGKKSI